MTSTSPNFLPKKLQWLMFLRVVFTTVLLGSTIVFQLGERHSLITSPLLIIYLLIGFVYLLTVVYVVILQRFGAGFRLAYAQISLDTLIVTLLIYVTGGASSAFSFLYLIVTVYASILLLKKDSFIMAVLCSLQYALLLSLEYYGFLQPVYVAGAIQQDLAATFIIYRVVATTIACFLIAFLSSHLAQLTVITEKELKAKQHDLQKLEAFNASIVQSMDSGLLTLDVTGAITSFNSAAESITGFQRSEVIGKRLADIFPQATRYYTQSIETPPRRPYRQDINFTKKDGSAGYLGFSLSSLKAPDGKAIGHLLIFQDLTALKIMESHIKRVEMLAAVGEMAAGMAHEIKNPLTSMTGSIQMLEKEMAPTGVAAKLMNIVLREADRLNGLINDFLLFARPSSGKANPLDLRAVVDETLDLFETDAACRDRVAVTRDLAPGVWARMDLKHMRQMLWNLLRNAAQAIEGMGRIHVGLKAVAGMAEITVEDDGRGMSEETQKNIFDPFFTTRSQGTGLGLSIVHRLLESYGGQIDVASRVGRGTAVTLNLATIEAPVPERDQGVPLGTTSPQYLHHTHVT